MRLPGKRLGFPVLRAARPAAADHLTSSPGAPAKRSTTSQSTLSRRLAVVFILVIAIPVALLWGLLVVVSERALIQSAARESRQTVERIAQSIDEAAREEALWAAALSSDRQILGAAARFVGGQNEAERAVAADKLDEAMASFFDYTNKIGSVLIFLHGRAPYVYRNSSLLFELPVDRDGWYAKTLRTAGRTRFLQDLRSYSLGEDRRPVLSVAVAPGGAWFRAGVEAFLISFRVVAFDSFTGDSVAGRELVLLDGAGRPILSTGDGVIAPAGAPGEATGRLLAALSKRGAGGQAVGAPPESGPARSHPSDSPESPAWFRLDVGRMPFLVLVAEVPSTGWRLVSALPYADITRSVDLYSRLGRYALLVLLVLFIAYIEVTFLRVIRPLRVVIDHMRKVEAGNYSVAVDVTGPTEVVLLGTAFNSMVREVRRLTAEKEANERERARLELEALRLQINPHFLSNTLNSIRLMAVMSKAENIQAMTSALMKVVTDSFSREGSLDRVRNELEMLESYVLIMRVRYGDSFTVSYEVDSEVGELFMLRMLLQPIVENSILHGFQDLKRKGRIEVRARRVERELRIEIVDNGHGMTPEAARAALCEDAPSPLGLSRVGLANVARRIALNHGGSFGLSIESSEGLGATVLIRLPVIRKGEIDVSGDGG